MLACAAAKKEGSLTCFSGSMFLSEPTLLHEQLIRPNPHSPPTTHPQTKPHTQHCANIANTLAQSYFPPERQQRILLDALATIYLNEDKTKSDAVVWLAQSKDSQWFPKSSIAQ